MFGFSVYILDMNSARTSILFEVDHWLFGVSILKFLFVGWLGFGGIIFSISHLVYSTLGPADITLAPPSPIPPYKGSCSTSKKIVFSRSYIVVEAKIQIH